MYRLVAEPFLKQGWTVAILGYRTYPDGTAKDQCDDCAQAIKCLADEFPEWRRGEMTVIGHSSGRCTRHTPVHLLRVVSLFVTDWL
jgi:acetyl esterase/lipase